MDDRDLSPGEVAAQLGVSARTVLREIRAGELRAYRVRGSWRIEPSEVRAYRARHPARPRPGDPVTHSRH